MMRSATSRRFRQPSMAAFSIYRCASVSLMLSRDIQRSFARLTSLASSSFRWRLLVYWRGVRSRVHMARNCGRAASGRPESAKRIPAAAQTGRSFWSLSPEDAIITSVVQTSHGCTLMVWRPRRNNWYSAEAQETPAFPYVRSFARISVISIHLYLYAQRHLYHKTP